jgi:hypothetical protein
MQLSADRCGDALLASPDIFGPIGRTELHVRHMDGLVGHQHTIERRISEELQRQKLTLSPIELRDPASRGAVSYKQDEVQLIDEARRRNWSSV